MSIPGGPTLAPERTVLARVRTVAALLLVTAVVARTALPAHPAIGIGCLAVAGVSLALAVRLGTSPTGPGRATVLACCVVGLAVIAGAGLF